MVIANSQTRLRTRRCAAAAAPLACALALPISAQASDPGINFDPGSPAGKEYAIPLVQGRAIGAGTTNQHSAANTPFGVGIKPPSGGAGAGDTTGGRGNGAGGAQSARGRGLGRGGGRNGGSAGRGGAGGSGSGVAPIRLTPKDRARLLHAEEPGGTGLLTVGLALTVLLPALLVAALLRRRPEQPAG